MTAGRGGDTLATLLNPVDSTLACVIVPEDELILTFEELRARVGGMALLLKQAGVERGQRVALALPDGPEYLTSLLAVMLIGTAAAPLNTAYKANELRSYLADIRPDAVLVPSGGGKVLREVIAPETNLIEVRPSAGRGATAAVGDSFLETAAPDDVALLLHTSGTTGAPKLVPLLHRNVAASANTIARHYALSERDVSCCAMPLVHVHALICSTFAAWASGGAVVVSRRFTPSAVAELIDRHRVTWLSASPTVHVRTLESCEPSRLTGRLRFVRSCSAALPPRLQARMEAVYEAPVSEAYGMTEASHQIAANPVGRCMQHPGSVGYATGTEIHIAGSTAPRSAEEEQGEVLIRGPGLTPGYLDERAQAAAFAGGWFHTGDLGVLRHGRLYLTGRLKDLIVRGGENIAPYEVEQVLLEHPNVLDAACFGIDDPIYGEQPSAAIVLSAPTTPRELVGHCREHLADFKLPRLIHFVDALPRTTTGKINRRELKRRYQTTARGGAG